MRILAMFKDSKVGDRVWSKDHGWGTIITTYPLRVKMEHSGVYDTFTIGGRKFTANEHVSLFKKEMLNIPTELIEQHMPDKVRLVYLDNSGNVHTQYVSDLVSQGTLVDPETGDDMNIVAVFVHREN